MMIMQTLLGTTLFSPSLRCVVEFANRTSAVLE